ncbi:MAG: glycosyltransferase family 39 protein [Muribaculaceae bacterium]|nr:glycosyltransferase family 39 protein [Muribaculaceae bacterium]
MTNTSPSITIRQTAILWITSIAIQLITVIIGFDICDTGYYMTFYDNIFDSPASVGHNFMYYLSGVIGGLWLKIFPGSGVFGIRILGLIFNLLSATAIYIACRRFVPFKWILAGTIMIFAGYFNMPMAFYNDTLTVTLIAAALTVMYIALKNNRYSLIFLSGLIFGINLFSRVPNILDILFVILPVIHGIYSKHKPAYIIKLSCFFIGGYILAVCAALSAMHMTGHLDIYLETLKSLTATASDSTQSHGLVNLINTQVRGYIAIARQVVYILVCLTICSYVGKNRVNNIIRLLAYIFVAAIFTRQCLRCQPVFLLAALSVTGCLAVIVSKTEIMLKTIAVGGTLAMFIIPMGSDGGMINNGAIILFAAMPPALAGLSRFKPPYLTPVKPAVVTSATVIFTIISFYTLVVAGTYFDPTPLSANLQELKAPRAKGIYTSAARVETVSTMTAMIDRRLEPGDTLLVYGSAPMINYLTATRPAIGCSWPELLSETEIKSRLDKIKPGQLPAVLLQRFNSIGAIDWNPSDEYAAGGGTQDPFHTIPKTNLILSFLKSNNYQIADSTNSAILYIPQ